MRRLQQCDPKIGPVVTWVETGVRPQRDEFVLRCRNQELSDAELSDFASGSLLCRRFERTDGICHHMQLLMPRSLRPSFLKMVHGQSTGHFGYEKTLEQVQRRAYWDCSALAANRAMNSTEGSYPRKLTMPISQLPSTQVTWCGSFVQSRVLVPVPSGLVFRLDALALSVIATATWLGGWLAGWRLAGCHTPVLYQNR